MVVSVIEPLEFELIFASLEMRGKLKEELEYKPVVESKLGSDSELGVTLSKTEL